MGSRIERPTVATEERETERQRDRENERTREEKQKMKPKEKRIGADFSQMTSGRPSVKRI